MPGLPGPQNAFVQAIGCGWYRYHTLFAEMLRLKLRYEHPDRVALLLRRAAGGMQRKGMLADAVRQAARAGDWPLAAAMVIDELAIGQLIDPGDGQRLAAEFAGLPSGRTWTQPRSAPSSRPRAVMLLPGERSRSPRWISSPIAGGIADPPEQDPARRFVRHACPPGPPAPRRPDGGAAPAAHHAEPMLNQAPPPGPHRHPA